MDEEFLKFDRVQNKMSKRRDLHAFLLLDRLVPTTGDYGDIVSAAEHDEIWLEVQPSDLESVLTEDLAVELIRCGVRLDSHYESLCMFV